MFNKITLKNYRTHRETSLELGPVTLLIGNNNSGKSNLLAGIQHFSGIVRRGDPRHPENYGVKPDDYFPHRYRLAKDNEGISIAVDWQNAEGQVVYQMEIYKGNQGTACKEEIRVTLSGGDNNQLNSGFEHESNSVNLRKAIEDSATSFKDAEKQLCRDFFQAFALTFGYHLQPSFLKGSVPSRLERTDSETRINIPAKLGYEGGNLQKLLLYAKDTEERVFGRFIASMRRFSNIFSGLRGKDDNKTAIWEFDLGRKGSGRQLDEFPAYVVSDGMLKASAIALLLSLDKPPALILLEEIENGINPANIQLLMSWIWQAATSGPNKRSTQFILTSHSPSVLREFHEKPHCVYVVRLEKRNFSSTVTNLNQALKTLRDIGAIDEVDDIEVIEEGGREIIRIPKYRLAELWYSGTIG